MLITVAEASVAAGLSPGGASPGARNQPRLATASTLFRLRSLYNSLDGALPRVPLSSIAQQFESSAQNATPRWRLTELGYMREPPTHD